MKKIFNIVFPLLVLLISACEKQLNLTPEDKLSPTTYFMNELQLQLWTNQFYSQLDDADGQVGQNADDNVDNALGDLMTGQRDAASESGWNWTMLRKINYYLQNSSNCADAAARKRYDGVAYFFRAYFYFVKVRRYGDVPWYSQVLESTDDELLFKSRDDRALIMDSVMKDINMAIVNLPTTKNISTVTKWTALALKSRMALYEGTYRKYHGLNDANKYLQQAADAAEEFMNNSGYSLYNTGTEPYRNLFNSDNAIASEVVLTRIYSATANVLNGVPFNIINGKQGFTRRYMNHYLMADGSRFSDKVGWETMVYMDETKNRDPRMRQTVLCPGYIQKGASTVTRNTLNAVTGYQPIKFVAEAAYDGATKSITDWPLFRAAEVYLNFAEAKAELGTLTQGNLDLSINKIRTRANMPAVLLTAANAATDPLMLQYYPNVSRNGFTGVILEIRRERTVELALEGFRQWDLLRWKEGGRFTGPFYGCYFPGPGRYDTDGNGTDDLVLWTGTPQTISGGTSKQIGVDIKLSETNSGYIVAYPNIVTTWNEQRDYLWPIPSSERVLTRGKLTQNLGWTDSSGF